MDYDKEEQAFYSRLDADPLSDSAIALWHALRVICKVVGRTEGLSVPQGTLCSKAGLRNPKSLERARNQLTSKGMITWRARGKDKATIYSLESLARQNEAYNVTRQNEPQNGVHSGVQYGVHSGVQYGVHSGVENGALYIPTTNKDVGYITRQNEPQNGVHSGVCQPEPFLTDEEGYRGQASINAVTELARQIGMNHGDYMTIDRIVADYSTDWCVEALNRARVNAKGIPSWKYVESILKRWREAGGIDTTEKPMPAATPDDKETAKVRRRQQAQSAKILRGEYE